MRLVGPLVPFQLRLLSFFVAVGMGPQRRRRGLFHSSKQTHRQSEKKERNLYPIIFCLPT